MKYKKQYTSPTSEGVRLGGAIADNSYDPSGESGLIGLSGGEKDAGMGQAPAHPDENLEPTPFPKRANLWEEH